MTTQIVTTTFKVPTLADLITALTDIEREATARGHDASTVYANIHRIALVEERLTDGSTVLNLDFAEGE